jgi:parallel beta-helix repeat protein
LEADGYPARLLTPPGDYDVHIYGGDGPYSATLAGLRGAYALSGIPATPGTRDELAFRIVNGNAEHNELAIVTGDAGKPITATWTRGSDPGGDRRLYRIESELGAGDMLWIKALPDLSGAVVANRGDAPLIYRLRIQNEMIREGVPTPAAPPTLIVGPLELAPGETDAVVPDDWGNLSGSGVSVTTSICGDSQVGPGEDSVNCPDDAGAPLACVEPHDDMLITADTLLCSGTYEIPDEGSPGVLIFDAPGVKLDCNGATLLGDGEGIGIRAAGTDDVTVTGCTVSGYAHGIFLDDVSGGTVTQSVLTANEEWGLHTLAGTGLQAGKLYIADNGNGLLISGGDGANLDKVTVCPNTGIDIAAWDGQDLTGTDNACDAPDGWHDTGVDGCTYACTGAVTITRAVYLPLVVRGSR